MAHTKPRLSSEDIADSKQFWASRYSTAGAISNSATMRQYKRQQFWQNGEYEMINCMDAPEHIPMGSSKYCEHMITRT